MPKPFFTMDYLDFVLRFESAAGDYAVQLDSPEGEERGRFAVPVEPSELARLAEGCERRLGAFERGEVEAARKEEPALCELARSIGERLFRGLFSQPLRDPYMASLGRLRQGGDELGLRIKLRMDLSDPALARLHDLPWELLCDSGRGGQGFLGLRRTTPIVRSLDLPLPPGRPVLPASPRILVVLSEPSGQDLEGLGDELRRIQEAGLGEVRVLRRATLARVREELRTWRPHVLHFLGHGTFDPDRGQGFLLLESELSLENPVTGEAFARQLQDFSTLRLVFLNACSTAQTSAGAPYAGVATALLRAGVPAVVAMQLPVDDMAAVQFAETVYRCLAAGEPIEAAVTEGRLTLEGLSPNSIDWCIPVLFLRAPEMRLPQEAVPRAVVTRPERRPAWIPYGWAALLLGAGVASWLGLPRLLENPGAEAPSDPTEIVLPQPSEPQKALEPEPKTALQEPSQPPPQPEPESDQEEERTDAPAPSFGRYTVRDGESVTLREVGAVLTLQFQVVAGESLVRCNLRFPGAGESLVRTIGGPSDLEIPPAKGFASVEKIDWEAQTVEVHVGVL